MAKESSNNQFIILDTGFFGKNPDLESRSQNDRRNGSFVSGTTPQMMEFWELIPDIGVFKGHGSMPVDSLRGMGVFNKHQAFVV